MTANSDSDAKDKAEKVKAKGGAGYVYSVDKFYIIASVYEDRTQAEAIAKKNGGSVIACSLPTLSFFDKSRAKEVSAVYEKIIKYVHFLIELSYGYDTRKESVEERRDGREFYLLLLYFYLL